MVKRLAFCLALLAAPLPALAVDYTDIYYIPAEAGWGVNVVQSTNFMFVTFFIYGADNKPTWYTANLTLDASGNFNGPLYATTGTYYAMPWKPTDLTQTAVGTASFQPTGPYTAKLVYTVTTPPGATVTKAIQRQALTPIVVGGSYVFAQSGAYSGCSNASLNGAYSDFGTLTVTQSTGGAVVFSFTYQALSCTFSGTLTQFGKTYTMPTTAYVCSDGTNTNAMMDEITATSFGLFGRFAAPSEPGGCREDASFSAVLH
jgi:hypothetical protein